MKIRESLLILVIFHPFITFSQSWMQERSIRTDEPKVTQIIGHIIPCDERDSIFKKEISIDSSSYIRIVEKFNKDQNIIYSSQPSMNQQSTRVNKYQYDKRTLIFESESHDERVTKEVRYKKLKIGVIKKTVNDLIRNDSTSFLIMTEEIDGSSIEHTYKLPDQDTILESRKVKNPFSNIMFFKTNDVDIYYIQSRDKSNRVQNNIIVGSDGRINNTAYIKAEFKNGKLNVNKIDIPEDVDTLYLEQLDEFGNIIRHIIVDQMKNCLTTWYYDIEYKTEK